MTSPTSVSPAPGFEHPHSCTVCYKRKVKCDRKHPCSNCLKHQTECEFRDPLPRQRKRKHPEREDGDGTADAMIMSRLRSCEDTLRKIGIDPMRVEDGDLSLGSKRSADSRPGQDRIRVGPGRLISKEGRSIYIDNNVWQVVSNELQDAECIIPGNANASDQQRSDGEGPGLDEGALLFGAASKHNLTILHPNPVHIFKLWQVFLENVNPLTKIIHAPTLQQRILNASGDLGSIPEDLEALMFAIYCAALTSLDDNEVLQSFGEARSKLLSAHRQNAQNALVNAKLLKTSNLVVLQALIIFILSARVVYDPHTLWSLSGIAMRIAQRIGLHRDGSCLGLSVFETEMRRRLWWQVMIADAVIGRKSGSLASFAPISDTRAPLNVNDSELDPEMKETPVESTRPTEMLFCLSRYEFGQWLDRHSKSNQATFGGYWALISSPSIPAEEKERTIKEIEDSFEEKFVRFCDPSIPLHLMTMLVARSTGSIMRLTAHHPRLYHERGENPTQSEKDFLFETCISVAEYSNILMTSNKTRRYLWHVDYHFPWDILLFMLHELRHRTVGDQTAKAWHLIDATCNRQYQTLGSKARSPFHLAIASLAIKAWASHVAECERRRTSSIPQPNIISVFWPLSQQAQPSSTPQMAPSLSESGQGGPPTASNAAFSAYSRHSGDPFMPAIPIDSSTDFSSLAQMHPADDSPLDWGQWDGLLQDYQQQFSGENPFGAI